MHVTFKTLLLSGFLLKLLWLPAWSQSFLVPENSLLRLSAGAAEARFEQIEVAAGGNLLIPAGIKRLRVVSLTVGAGARLSVAPREGVFELFIEHGQFADGSLISARGIRGDMGVPGGKGTDVKFILTAAKLESLTIDVRGGQGGSGWNGAPGAAGGDAACWGRGADKGQGGADGSNGLAGGDGGNVELILAQSDWLEVIDLMLVGGAGGAAGKAGLGGQGGQVAGCLLYSLGRVADDGLSGQAGIAASAGKTGSLRVH